MTTSIASVLVANRGEIARRMFRTCRDNGIGCVAVYSDADARSPHVDDADVALRLPGSAPAETYLRADLLIDAACAAGADAIHPGYGFLSENAAFARAVGQAGLTWIGPPPEAIEAMGSKIEAKRLMAAAGVPVLPELDPGRITEADLPVLVKASAGGGGRGMRVIASPAELAELPGLLEAARAQAASAFGDPAVFCEPYLGSGRHVEVQVLADEYGTAWAVGERECSIQRRHQKVVEEAPSPFVQRRPGLRERLFDAARAGAAAVGYVGAGTVEFLVGPDGRFFFLEMNTRLQVEHPVTECTTGLDLVHAQIRLARGGRRGAEPPRRGGHGGYVDHRGHGGHAIEVRLYAENPAENWQPQAGTLHHIDVPGVIDASGVTAEFTAPRDYGIRLDSGVVDGCDVSVHYDPMLAKVIAWAPDRDTAAQRLAGTLARAKIHGLVTNRDLLVRVLRHPAFLAGDTDTAFFATHDLAALARPLADEAAESLSVLAAALADAAHNTERAAVLGGLPSGWRNIVSAPQRKRYRSSASGGLHTVAYRFERSGLVADGYDDVRLVTTTARRVVLDAAGLRRTFEVARYPGLVCVDSPLGAVELRPLGRFDQSPTQSARSESAAQSERQAGLAPGSLLAAMPGTVVRIAVSAGDVVQAGQPLLWLEAMKMQHPVAAQAAGVVAELPVAVGQLVEAGAVLAVITLITERGPA